MGDLIVEKNGVKGDAKDIALLFKETGVDLGQFLKKDSNTNRPTNVPGWVCIVLFVVLCIICGAIYIVPIENIWVNILKFASVCICAILIFYLNLTYDLIYVKIYEVILDYKYFDNLQGDIKWQTTTQ